MLFPFYDWSLISCPPQTLDSFCILFIYNFVPQFLIGILAKVVVILVGSLKPPHNPSNDPSWKLPFTTLHLSPFQHKSAPISKSPNSFGCQKLP